MIKILWSQGKTFPKKNKLLPAQIAQISVYKILNIKNIRVLNHTQISGSNLIKLDPNGQNWFKLDQINQTCFLNFRNWKNADLHHPLQPQNLHVVEHLSCNYETKRINLIFEWKKRWNKSSKHHFFQHFFPSLLTLF